MRILTVLAIIFALLGALLAFAVFNLNGLVNKNKGVVISKIENSLDRKIEVGEIGVSIFGGLGFSLDNFKIEDDPAFSDGNFVEATKLIVNVKFLPLLKKDLQIKKFTLDDPVINLIRDKNGTYNFSSLIKESKKDTKEGGKETSYFIGIADISNGTLHYEDRKDNTNIQVSQIDFSSEGIEKNKPVSFDLAIAVLSTSQNIKVNGTIGPSGETGGFYNSPVDLSVNIDSVNFADLNKNFPQIKEFLPQGLGLNGPLKTSFNAKGTSSKIEINDLKLNGAVFGSKSQNLNISGNVGPVGPGAKENVKLNLTFSLDPVEFQNLRNFDQVGDSLPKELSGEGPVKLKGKISGTQENFTLSSVEFNASETKITYGDLFVKEKGTAFTIATDSEVGKTAVNFKTISILLNKLEVDIKGTMGLGDKSGFDLSLISNNADLGSLADNLVSLKDYNVKGNLDINLNLKETSEDPKIYGTVKLINIGASPEGLVKPITGINGIINFSGNGAKLDKTEFDIGGSKLFFDADITDFSPLTGSYDLTSAELHLSDMSKTATKGEVFKDIKIAGKINADGTQSADISSSKGKVSKVNYKKLNGTATLKDGVIDFNHFKFDFLNAKFSSRGTFDLSGDVPKFQMKTELTGVSVTELAKTFLNPTKYPLVGVSSIKLVFKGVGKGWEEISKTIEGKGSVEIKEGGIKNVNIADSVVKGITGVPGLTNFISDDIKDKHPSVFRSRDTKFYNFSSPITINDGKVNMDNINIKTKAYEVNGKGYVGLDGSMNMNGVVALSGDLSDDLVEKKDLVKYLKNSNGQVEIPFKMDESMKPQPDMDYLQNTFQKAAKEKSKEQLKKKIIESLSSDKDDESEGQQLAPGEKPPAKEEKKDGLDGLIDEGLDKVFGY